MKKTALLLALALCLPLAACAPKEEETTQAPTTEAPVEDAVLSYEMTYQAAHKYEKSDGSTWVSAVWEISNTGNVPMQPAPIYVDLLDDTGAFLTDIGIDASVPGVVPAGGKGYYTFMRRLEEGAGEGAPMLPEVELSATQAEELPLFAATNVTLSDDPEGGINATGTIQNQSGELQEDVWVEIILFDMDDKPAYALVAWPTLTLLPDEQADFEASEYAMPDDFNAEDVLRFEVHAYPMTFDF